MTGATLDPALRLPIGSDNAAVALRRVEAGSELTIGGSRVPLRHTLLEGHRVIVDPVGAGGSLRSWGLSFGQALTPLVPGDVLFNHRLLDVLGRRTGLDLTIPGEPNMTDRSHAGFHLDPAALRPGPAVEPVREPASFSGFHRPGGRGVGTRNHVVVIGLTSRSGPLARAIARRLEGATDRFDTVDRVVAVAHTEGGEQDRPTNLELLLRTIAGFCVHPNVGAAVLVEEARAVVDARAVFGAINARGIDLPTLRIATLTRTRSFTEDLERGTALVRDLIPVVAGDRRAPASAAHLSLALQCGGSDAFSGISANPLLGAVARRLIRNGGAANLAETDELIGAEPYVLANVRDAETASRFLALIERFKERVAWHGQTAEANPSGGNLLRGLCNVTLKSIGAATKRDPDVRLEDVIEYGAPLQRAGLTFMDSPGNDLESIAGQVASGCNLIAFTTGNGSITNFPFVPTIKIVTTTGRFELLADDMDVNAGRYLDGEPMADLADETFELLMRVADGQRTVGERAGHAQVSIWRAWRRTSLAGLDRALSEPEPDGKPLAIAETPPLPSRVTWTGLGRPDRAAVDAVGLILPTSLCSGQVGQLIADRLSDEGVGRAALSVDSSPCPTPRAAACPGVPPRCSRRGRSPDTWHIGPFELPFSSNTAARRPTTTTSASGSETQASTRTGSAGPASSSMAVSRGLPTAFASGSSARWQPSRRRSSRSNQSAG